MKTDWNLLIELAGVAALAGSIAIALPYFITERNVESQKPQQQKYAVSRPQRCSEIMNGGRDSGEYLFCKTPDGYSLFYKSFDAKNWSERQYK